MRRNTEQDLLDAAKAEFLEKGFKDASLRRIAGAAGLTTGAIYAHYPDKNALFEALVGPTADQFMSVFVKAQGDFASLTDREQIGLMFTYSDDALLGMLEMVYDNFDIYRLIFCRSDGTKYETFLHDMVEIECEGTYRFIELLRRNGYAVREMPPNLIHMLNNAYFSSVFETVAHGMSREEAFAYVHGLVAFFNAGWKTVLGV